MPLMRITIGGRVLNPFKNENREFETAYGLYADMIYRLSFSYMKNKEDAEDVVQEVFTKYFCLAKNIFFITYIFVLKRGLLCKKYHLLQHIESL